MDWLTTYIEWVGTNPFEGVVTTILVMAAFCGIFGKWLKK